MDDREKDIAKENLESKEGGEKHYDFITETIKKRPVNKKKILSKILFTIFLAIVFALVASITFVVAYPYIKGYLNPEETKQVTLPVTEEVLEEPVEEFVPKDEDEENIDDVSDENSEENKETLNEADLPENVDEGEANTEVVINQVVETIEKELELDDYRTLYRKIAAVGSSVQKCMVNVSGISSNTDWFNNQYEDNNTASGVIVADNGKELLIVSMASILDGADEVEVTFCDGKTYKSTVKKSDISTGLTIVAVELDKIEETTLSKIEMASFGSISNMVNGTPILAIGSPQGVPDSMALGQITSSSIVDIVDGSVKILSTDIYGSTSATGVLVNLNGRILGFICHEKLSDMPNLIKAYSIIDLKDKIEKISNGQDLVYLGIIGTDVTESAYDDLGVPFGTYVKKVDMDSPAMEAGIRSGDVIVKIGTSDINSFNDYKEAILKAQPGDQVVIKVMRPGRDHYFDITYEITLKSL